MGLSMDYAKELLLRANRQDETGEVAGPGGDAAGSELLDHQDDGEDADDDGGDPGDGVEPG